MKGDALLLAALACGYRYAWVGHCDFKKNRPALFKHPWYSFLGDGAFADTLRSRVKFSPDWHHC